jgi:putative endonuclease
MQLNELGEDYQLECRSSATNVLRRPILLGFCECPGCLARKALPVFRRASSFSLGMPHHAYMQSDSDASFYPGSSHDPVLRCQRHNEGWTRSTKGKGPWKLVLVREFPTKSEALQFERHIKKMKNRAFIERSIGSRPVLPQA